MSMEALEEEGKTCPIVRQWMEMPVVVSRAVLGKIAELGTEGVTRETVAANADVLAPLIREYGIFT